MEAREGRRGWKGEARWRGERILKVIINLTFHLYKCIFVYDSFPNSVVTLLGEAGERPGGWKGGARWGGGWDRWGGGEIHL